MGNARPRLPWSGLAAAVWYTAVVLIGAMATPGYSHIGDHVSTPMAFRGRAEGWLMMPGLEPA